MVMTVRPAGDGFGFVSPSGDDGEHSQVHEGDLLGPFLLVMTSEVPDARERALRDAVKTHSSARNAAAIGEFGRAPTDRHVADRNAAGSPALPASADLLNDHV
jgi:hypothetical protein